MIDYMTDKRIDDTLDAVTEEAKYSNYFDAAEIFLDKTNEYFETGVPGGHYRVDEATGKIIRYKVITPLELSIAVIGALVISLRLFLYFNFQISVTLWNSINIRSVTKEHFKIDYSKRSIDEILCYDPKNSKK
jgi:hypothetical protein